MTNMLKKSIRNFAIDTRAALRLSDRDSRGRFVRGNKYRLRVTEYPLVVHSGDTLEVHNVKVTTFPNKAVLYHA